MDVGAFYRLMAKTCERQRTKPTPATESALQEIWNTFCPNGHIRLFMAEFEGDLIAGLLCICFGKRVVAWKKGWNEQHAARHPNALLTFEAIEWSHNHGYACVDFNGIRRDLAHLLLSGKPFPQGGADSVHWFNLGFGSKPLLLPEPQLYISNPIFRFAYQIVMASRHGQNLATQFVGSRI